MSLPFWRHYLAVYADEGYVRNENAIKIDPTTQDLNMSPLHPFRVKNMLHQPQYEPGAEVNESGE